MVGLSCDAAGNPISDGIHSYTYDAEGNLLQVDGGATATYQYSALNQRVRVDEGGNAEGFIYNQNGQRVSIWNMNSGVQIRGDTYWGGLPVEFNSNGQANYVHADWQGTDQIYTSYNGTVEGSFTGLPFGDGSGATGSGFDPWVSAQMDKDYYNGSDSGTDHAQYRQYGDGQGRWLSPDPYSGSYDFSNPQSLNRYSYVVNNPLAFTDPSGLTVVPCAPGSGATFCVDVGAEAGGAALANLIPYVGLGVDVALGIDELGKLLGWWGAPKFHGSLKPRPNASNNGNIDCSKPPPSAPQAPPGVNTDSQIANFFEANYDPTGTSTLFSAFQTGGPMDYKQLSPAYTDYGNFLYGAACQALNGSSTFCHGAAGLNRDYRALRSGLPLGSGIPFVSAPMGDQAQDYRTIQAGIDYQKWVYACEGTVY